MKTLKSPSLVGMLKLLMILGISFLSGCVSTRVVFINPSDDVIRIGPNVKGKVYYYNKEEQAWQLSTNKSLIPEGWYAGNIDISDGSNTREVQPVEADN